MVLLWLLYSNSSSYSPNDARTNFSENLHNKQQRDILCKMANGDVFYSECRMFSLSSSISNDSLNSDNFIYRKCKAVEALTERDIELESRLQILAQSPGSQLAAGSQSGSLGASELDLYSPAQTLA